MMTDEQLSELAREGKVQIWIDEEGAIESGALDEFMKSYLAQGGKVTQLPPGNALRDTDGESWKQTNDRKWQVKQDKERAK
jgi:hypothetical protein